MRWSHIVFLSVALLGLVVGPHRGASADTNTAAETGATGPVPDEKGPAAPPASMPVYGSATVHGNARSAAITWVWEEDGRPFSSQSPPPGLQLLRVSSNVKHMMLKLPASIFAIKIGTDMQRIFEEPLDVGSDQPAHCGCDMHPECGKGKTFRCEVEGYVVR